MIVELTNNYVEMSATYEVENIEENRYGNDLYFRFYFTNNKWSKEYKTPNYSYRILRG